ncbi:MAG: choice-of-anchor J domain-containing protein [Flavobacteriaceae bacterium]|nr:choice-of-anchor J domain-containing protein [Flavobacteriaceae bacterium]
MKHSNIYKLILFLMVATFVASCVEDDDFGTPDLTVNDPQLESTPITIDALYGQFLQEGIAVVDDLGIDPSDPSYDEVLNGVLQDLKITFDEGTSYIEGYVISSDEAGNFFEEIILQNAPSNPTRGVRFLIDVNPLFTSYEFGRKVFIKLDGLSMGIENGLFTVGALRANEIEKVASSLLEETLLRSSEIATIEPLPVDFSDFSTDIVNLYVRLSDVQFNRNQVLGDDPLTFAAEPTDEFDGERILENCASGSTIIFSTSTFADFKAVQLPSGRGTMDGIFTLNFFGDTFNMVVNDPTNINFDSADRCDPDVYECDQASGGGDDIYSENFEQFNAIEDYVNAGWSNINTANSNGELWVIGNFSNNNYAQISGFNSGEDVIDTWLITPAIDMSATTGEELSFDIQVNFDNGEILTVLFSNDYAGDPNTATWFQLDADIPEGPSGGFGDFEPVGPINVSCVEGSMYVAFRYQGSDPDSTTRYHIDNLTVTGN